MGGGGGGVANGYNLFTLATMGLICEREPFMSCVWYFVYYSDVSRHSDSSLPVQFHIMFLQVLLMLAAEKDVMDREVCVGRERGVGGGREGKRKRWREGKGGRKERGRGGGGGERERERLHTLNMYHTHTGNWYS